MALASGQRVTLLKIDDCLAMTHRYELEICQVLAGDPVGYEGRQKRIATVRQKGKRKEQYLDLKPDDILLDGWDGPFKTDTECQGVWAGNACYNLIGEPEAIRQHIESKAIFPVSDSALAKILVSRQPRTSCDHSEVELLYPEIETHHAVISRMKAGV
jgi:hypothetical protein